MIIRGVEAERGGGYCARSGGDIARVLKEGDSAQGEGEDSPEIR